MIQGKKNIITIIKTNHWGEQIEKNKIIHCKIYEKDPCKFTLILLNLIHVNLQFIAQNAVYIFEITHT